MRSMRPAIPWLLLISIVFLPACDRDRGVTPQEPPVDYDQEIQEGWGLFRARDFPGAAVRFRRVIGQFPDAADGHVGLGWCELEFDSLTAAVHSLETAIRLGDDLHGVAGLAVAASALGRDSLAVASAARITDPGYLFIGDPDFGHTDLVYIRALGEFHLLLYENCYASLRILQPDLEIDLNAFDFRERLFTALESLRGRV